MEEKSILLNPHEIDALKSSIEKYIAILDDQVSAMKSAKHLDNMQKKELLNTLGKRKDLLKNVLSKL